MQGNDMNRDSHRQKCYLEHAQSTTFVAQGDFASGIALNLWQDDVDLLIYDAALRM